MLADDVSFLGHELPIVSAIYPKKGVRALASHLLPETESVQFGKGGGLLTLTKDGDGVSMKKEYFKSGLSNRHGGVVIVGLGVAYFALEDAIDCTEDGEYVCE
ncbi:MAG: hypothetical protein HC774_02385 [Sphingomonadales bacterium]|nr:hypothetical protein [Sphingomonadales bacterium]